jgi:hypothetical protein
MRYSVGMTKTIRLYIEVEEEAPSENEARAKARAEASVLDASEQWEPNEGCINITGVVPLED